MKRIAILLYLLPFLASAQYFAPVGATWHYSEFSAAPITYQEYFMKFEVTGDTIIDGKDCTILEKEGKLTCYERPWTEYFHYSNDTVFVYNQDSSTFQMLYDFNANTGDSWEIVVPGFPTGDVDTNVVLVDSTDILTINGQSLKRQYVTYTFQSDEAPNYQYPSVIIERIGDTEYLFNYYFDLLGVCDFNTSGGLRCYEDSLLGLYETGIVDSCEHFELVSGLNENDLSAFQIIPNPSSDFIQVQLDQGSPEKIEFIDLHGKLILETQDNLINISEFDSGIYLVRVLANSKWTQRRLVKH